jgi:hypothetical protein
MPRRKNRRGNIMNKTKKHPTHKRANRMAVHCKQCDKLWDDQQPQKALVRIHNELTRLGIGTDDPVSGADAVDYLNELKVRLDKYGQGLWLI